jgi:Protein of unknown function (DUF5131)
LRQSCKNVFYNKSLFGVKDYFTAKRDAGVGKIQWTGRTWNPVVGCSKFSKGCENWRGVSVEDRKSGLPRIEHLRVANVAVRFLSIEPLLVDIGDINLDGIHWVIVGGESGPRARPFDLQWARSIVIQCRAQKVPCFVKQVGTRPICDGSPIALSDFKGGNPAEWPTDLRVRESPERSDSQSTRTLPKLKGGEQRRMDG